jgi:hypothetical protein
MLYAGRLHAESDEQKSQTRESSLVLKKVLRKEGYTSLKKGLRFKYNKF